MPTGNPAYLQAYGSLTRRSRTRRVGRWSRASRGPILPPAARLFRCADPYGRPTLRKARTWVVGSFMARNRATNRGSSRIASKKTRS